MTIDRTVPPSPADVAAELGYPSDRADEVIEHLVVLAAAGLTPTHAQWKLPTALDLERVIHDPQTPAQRAIRALWRHGQAKAAKALLDDRDPKTWPQRRWVLETVLGYGDDGPPRPDAADAAMLRALLDLT